MKKLQTFGKITIVLGILNLFRRSVGFYGFGGYVDNSWEIITISISLVILGVLMIFIGIKSKK